MMMKMMIPLISTYFLFFPFDILKINLVTMYLITDYVGGKDVSLEKVILFIAAYLLAQCPKEGDFLPF